MERIMSTEKKGEATKQEPQPSEPVAKATKTGEIELSERELARTTGGGTGQRIHKPLT
jgi:hypothetical protein